MAKKKKQYRRATRRSEAGKHTMGAMGAIGASIVQGQIDRATRDSSPNAARVTGIVSGLGAIAAVVTGNVSAGMVLLGPACAQSGIESSRADLMAKATAAAGGKK